MKKLNLGLSTATLLSVFMSSAAVAERGPSNPNVLFIIIDDLNDWLSCMGGASAGLYTQYGPAGRKGSAVCQRTVPGSAVRSVPDEPLVWAEAVYSWCLCQLSEGL